MIFEHIERLKQQFTDKYVVVDDSRPELQRFRGQTGNIKTINMSGRALVEFDGLNNIGWYDIDPSFLRVVAKPEPKPAESKKDKAAAPRAESPKSPAPGGSPAKPAAPAAGKSVADILAAARKPAGAAAAAPAEAKPSSGAGKAPAGKVAPGGKGMSMEEILAAARGKKGAEGPPAAAAAPAPPAAAPPAAAPPKAAARVAPGGKGMSMEEILAMARGKKAEGAAPPVVAKAAPAAEPTAEEPSVEEAAPEEVSVATPSAAETGGSTKSLKDKITSVAEQVAYCKKTDAKG